MESKRQKQVARQVQKDLGEIFLQKSSLWQGAFITITEVKVTPDLGIARVYLSVLQAQDENKVLELVEDKKALIRQELGQKVRHQLRKVPELNFFIDTTLAQAEKMEKLFENLHIPPAQDDEETLSKDDF
jgi:ribosome-binding factor A